MSTTEPSFTRMAQAIRDGRDQDAEQEFRALLAARDDARAANEAQRRREFRDVLFMAAAASSSAENPRRGE